MSCILCQSNDVEKLHSFGEYSICRCRVCSSLYADEVLDSKEHYLSASTGNSSLLRQKVANIAKSITAQSYYKYLMNHLEMQEISSVLDIGADRGHLLRLFEEKGARAVGIEADKTRTVNSVASDLRVGYFDEDYALDERFDLICFTQNMYYFRDNGSTLKKALSLLNRDGYIFVATANGDSPDVINHFANHGTPYNCACILSKKGWMEICKMLGCNLIDYSYYDSPMSNDIASRNWTKLPKYLLSRSKAYYETRENGYMVFLLLQKKNSTA
jgi:SAM-dependent methyltransferase